MSDYLNRGIKEVIEEYPAVGDILNEFEVGCTDCSVGTCLLKDVVNIHFLTPEQEKIMMQKIDEAIRFGDAAKIETGRDEAKKRRESEISYARPVQMLVDEHKLIKRLLTLIPSIVEDIKRSGLDRKMILDSVDFIRHYADRFHHAKEEDIMFKYVDEEAEIIRIMYEDHTTGRNHVQEILKALDGEDKETVIKHLLKYRDLLFEHIKKEDEILYPWIERQMTVDEIDEMLKAFIDEETRLGADTTSQYEALITGLENKLKIGEEVQS